MTDTTSTWFKTSAKDLDEELFEIQRPRKSHKGMTAERPWSSEARDDLCSLSSQEESVMGKESVSDDATTNEALQVDDEEIFVPVVKIVDSLNKWIFNDKDDHSCASVNDGSCTSNDDDSCDTGSCTSSHGGSSVSSSCCSSVDGASLGWSQTSSVRQAHKYLSTIQTQAGDHGQNKLNGHLERHSIDLLDDASLSTSVAESMWGHDGRNYALAEANRRVKNAVIDFDDGFDLMRRERDVLGTYMTDNEDNDDTLWADLESLHSRDHTKASTHDAASTIRNILKDVRESTCMEPTIEEGPRSTLPVGNETISYLGVSPPKSPVVVSSSVPESITAKRARVLPSSTMQFDSSRGQQELETRRLPTFSTTHPHRSGHTRSVQSVTPLASNRPDPVGGKFRPIFERVVTKHPDTQEKEAPASSTNKDTALASSGPVTHKANKKDSRAKRLVKSLRRARLGWKGRGPSRMEAPRRSQKKIKDILGKDYTFANGKDTATLNGPDTTRGVGALDGNANLVTDTKSIEQNRKNYSCLGDRFMFLISGCAPTKLEQVPHSPSSVTEVGQFPIPSSIDEDDEECSEHKEQDQGDRQTTMTVNPAPSAKLGLLHSNADSKDGVDKARESLQLPYGDVDDSIEKSLEDYHQDIAPRWRPWNGLVAFTRRPSGLLSTEEGPIQVDGVAVMATESMYGTNRSDEDIETGVTGTGDARNKWHIAEASHDELECRQGIETVLDKESRAWRNLERVPTIKIVANDASPKSTAKPKGRNIKSLVRWLSTRDLYQQGPKSKSVALTPSHHSSSQQQPQVQNNKLDDWQKFVAVRGQPQAVIVQSRNRGTRDVSPHSRMVMKNARCHLRGLHG